MEDPVVPLEPKSARSSFGKQPTRASGKPHAEIISSWSYDMEGHAKRCVERYFELANKTTSNCTKSQLHVLTMISSKNKNWDLLENCQKYALELCLNCLYLARIGRSDILWSVNKLARAVTQWTRACDKRLTRLTSYIHHTNKFNQYCHVGNTAQQCRTGLFQDSDFAGDLEDSKSTSGGLLCIFGSHTFVPISWMCKRQTSVSHSSTETEKFLLMWVYGWLISQLWIFGIW